MRALREAEGQVVTDAIALQATEQCRDLVARPQKWGIEPRPGLEPLDVVVKFNRAAAHTRSAYQCIITMKLTLDDGKTWRTESGLVAEGKTKGECLEMFYNWMGDPNAVFAFTEVVKAHELDALAKKALDDAQCEQTRVNGRAADNNRGWAERKLDQLGRKFGLVKPKVQA